jgi:hypothetical protein
MAQRALHDRTRVAFEAARRSGIDGHFHVSETDGLLVVLTTAKCLGFLNTVTITDDASLPELPAVLEQFRSAGINDPTVIAPDDDPARAARLDDLGLRPSATRPFTFIGLESAPPVPGAADGGRVRVSPVESPEDRARFLDVLLDGYDDSPEVERFIRAEHSSAAVNAYLAWVDDEPVAGAAMSWHEDGLVLGGAATLAPTVDPVRRPRCSAPFKLTWPHVTCPAAAGRYSPQPPRHRIPRVYATWSVQASPFTQDVLGGPGPWTSCCGARR